MVSLSATRMLPLVFRGDGGIHAAIRLSLQFRDGEFNLRERSNVFDLASSPTVEGYVALKISWTTLMLVVRGALSQRPV